MLKLSTSSSLLGEEDKQASMSFFHNHESEHEQLKMRHIQQLITPKHNISITKMNIYVLHEKNKRRKLTCYFLLYRRYNLGVP